MRRALMSFDITNVWRITFLCHIWYFFMVLWWEEVILEPKNKKTTCNCNLRPRCLADFRRAYWYQIWVDGMPEQEVRLVNSKGIGFWSWKKVIQIVGYAGFGCFLSGKPVGRRFDGKGHWKLWYVPMCGSGNEMGWHIGVNSWSSGSRFFMEESSGACESL